MPCELTLEAIESFLGEVKDTADPGAVRPSIGLKHLVDDWDRLGVRPGERVLLALPQSARLLDHFFGACLAGLVPALLPPAWPGRRQADLARELQARAVLTRQNLGCHAALERTGTVGGMQVSLLPTLSHGSSCSGEAILLSSGTSGVASACLFDLASLLLNAERHADSIGQRPGDTVLASLPFYFSFALVAQALATFIRGGRLLVASQPFTFGSYWLEIVEHRVTISSLTPALVHRMPQESWPTGLRVLTVGGDALEPGWVDNLLALRASQELYLTYGTTPAGPRVSTLAAHLEPHHRYSSVGRPLPGVQVFLRALPECPEGGELLVASPTLMKARLGRLESPGRDWADPGLLATGDLFRVDADGYLFFQNRLSDFILAGGNKICLASVRRLVASCQGVLSARTNPCPEGYDLTLVSRGLLPPEVLANHCMRLLAPAERPRNLNVLAEDGECITHFK